MNTVIISIHVLVCVLLIMLVLLQAGKASGMGSSLGGSNQALFDTKVTNSILGKATTIAAIIFMLTSLTMAYTHNHGGSSVINLNINKFANSDDFSSEDKAIDSTITEDVEGSTYSPDIKVD